MIKKILFIFAVLILMAGCKVAEVQTEQVSEIYEETENLKEFPPYEGKKKRLQIVKFGIPEDIVNKYPELADKRVGWGLYNRLIDGFYDTNRFVLIEEKEAIKERIFENWKMSQMGLVIEEEAIDEVQLSAPEYIAYAEVFEFSISHSEEVKVGAVDKANTTIIGIQIRLVDVKSGVYTPASGQGTSQTTSKSKGLWLTSDMEFDNTTVSIASEKAVNNAMYELLRRVKW